MREIFSVNYKSYVEEVRLLRSTFIRNISVKEKLVGLDEVEKAYQEFLAVDRESQDATHESNREYEKLLDWIREFQDACRIVLKDRPQLLEKVGILVRSAKPRKKKDNGSDKE